MCPPPAQRVTLVTLVTITLFLSLESVCGGVTVANLAALGARHRGAVSVTVVTVVIVEITSKRGGWAVGLLHMPQ